MSEIEIRSKIEKSLDLMNTKQLQSAWLILRELIYEKPHEESGLNKQLLDEKIKTGIQQLDNGEGRDFGQFLNEMEVKYAHRK